MKVRQSGAKDRDYIYTLEELRNLKLPTKIEITQHLTIGCCCPDVWSTLPPGDLGDCPLQPWGEALLRSKSQRGKPECAPADAEEGD